MTGVDFGDLDQAATGAAPWPDQEQPAADPAAPYGRRADGKPYTQSPEERQRIGDALRNARNAKAAKATQAPRQQNRRASSPPPKKSGGPSTSSPPKVTEPIARDYRAALTGLMALPISALAVIGQAQNSRALQLDAAALMLHTPTLVQAVQECAEEDARLARVLDRIVSVSAYGALIAAVVPIVAQLAHNHGAIPAVAELGVYTDAELIAEVERRAAESRADG